MSSYPAYENVSHCKLDNNYQTVIVTLDIKYIVLIAHIISCWKIDFYVGKVFPFRFFGNVIPTFKSNLGIFLPFRFVKLFQSSM